MVISFNPKFNIGDIVYPQVDPEYKQVVFGWTILNIDDYGNVLLYNVETSNVKGTNHTYRPYELELFSEVEKEK